MYELKAKIYLDLSKTQKTALCNFLRALVKKLPQWGVDEIFSKFIDDEIYYLKINSPHFEFLKPLLQDLKFENETKLYLKECQKYYNNKKAQEPIIQAKKAFEKKKRLFLNDVKMSKQKPTQKQLYYYDKLSKKYNIEPKQTKELSKLDLKNMIEEILNEHQTN